jgi:hypothetical protein
VRIPGHKELVYDSIGADIPEEVQQVLQTKLIEIDKTSLNLNMAEQVALPFLLDLPGSSRLKLFNKLTGNDLLDVVVQNFNKEILNTNREIKSAKEIVAQNEPQVKTLEQEISIKTAACEKYLQSSVKINEKFKLLKGLKELNDILISNNTETQATNEALAKIKDLKPEVIETLKARIKVLTDLKTLDLTLKRCVEGLDKVNGQIAQIKTPELNTEHIKGLVDRLKRAKEAQSKLQDLDTKKAEVESKLTALNKVIPADEAEYQAILKEAGICPVCKQDTTKCEVHL